MRERREAQLKTAKEDPAKQILVAYASQTGTAHEIAKGLHAQLASQTSTKVAVLSAFNDVNIKNLRADKFPIVAFVAASTGDGDPPDNTASFYAKMLRMKSEDRYVLWLCECERRKKKEERVTNGSRKKNVDLLILHFSLCLLKGTEWNQVHLSWPRGLQLHKIHGRPKMH